MKNNPSLLPGDPGHPQKIFSDLEALYEPQQIITEAFHNHLHAAGTCRKLSQTAL